ncbi:MAG: hypothetical protein ACREOO_21220 [bacterium]
MTEKIFMTRLANGKTDVLQGKIWAFSDEHKRQSKRQKDLADIFRLVEAYPHLKKPLPKSIQSRF